MSEPLRIDHLAARFRALGILALDAYESLDSHEVDEPPNGGTNSATTLMLHMAGALRHYVGHKIGETEYVRDRAAEFTHTPSREVAATEFRQALADVHSTLAGLSDAKLRGPSSEPDYYQTIAEDLLGALVHTAVHVGQLIHIAKAADPTRLRQTWMTAHGDAGVWNTKPGQTSKE